MPYTLRKVVSFVALAVLLVVAELLTGVLGTSDSLAGPRSAVSKGMSAEVMGVYFTPPTGAAGAIVEAIESAQQEVVVQAYGFTHNGIAQAILRAQKRGVSVRVLMDEKSRTTNQYVIDLLLGDSVPYRLDGKHAIAHNKVMVIDTQIVVTGSYNFTNAAETRNAENVLILRSVELARAYRENFEQHWAHARP